MHPDLKYNYVSTFVTFYLKNFRFSYKKFILNQVWNPREIFKENIRLEISGDYFNKHFFATAILFSALFDKYNKLFCTN